MNTFALELWDDEASKCRFYTVRWDGAVLNETDKFFKKYYAIKEYKEAVREPLSFVLDSIGEFVFLYPNFPLRLYALKVNNRSDLVILFIGGAKSAHTNQASKDLNLKWVEACQFARRIEEAIRTNEIAIDNKGRIVSSDGEHEIYL